MTANLSFEWLKLEKRWMPRIIAVLLAGLIVVAFWGEGTRGDARGNLFLPFGWLTALTLCSTFAPFFWPVLGGSWAGSEYGWGTIRTILTRRPQRMTHVIAAQLVLLVGVALALLAVLVAGTLAGIVVAVLTNNPIFTSSAWDASFLSIVAQGFLAAWFVSGFYLVMAYAAATICRSAAVGIGIGVGATLAQTIVGEIFRSLGGVWQTIADHFPLVYSESMITAIVGSRLPPGSAFSRVSPTSPTGGQSLLALAIYGVIFVALTLVAVQTRDVTA